MLVLTRKTQQQIQIGDNITITIVRVKGQAVRVGIDAPEQVRVIRKELAASQPSKPAQPAAAPAAEAPADEASTRCDAAADELPAQRIAPLASRCRSRALAMPAMTAETKTCVDDRRRVPGASFTPMVRRPQRLGPASLGAMAGRWR